MAAQRKRSGTGPRRVTVHYFEKPGAVAERVAFAATLPELPEVDPHELLTETVEVGPFLDEETQARGKPRGNASRQRKPTGEVLTDQVLFAHQLFEQQRVEEARHLLEEVIARGAREAYPHTLLGTVYLALGRRDRALALFEAALLIDSADVAARVYRGEIRLSQGRLAEARSDLKQVLREAAENDPFLHRAQRLLKSATHASSRSRRP